MLPRFSASLFQFSTSNESIGEGKKGLKEKIEKKSFELFIQSLLSQPQNNPFYI